MGPADATGVALTATISVNALADSDEIGRFLANALAVFIAYGPHRYIQPDGQPDGQHDDRCQAVGAASASPNLSTDSARIWIFLILPVTVIGKSSVKITYRGIL